MSIHRYKRNTSHQKIKKNRDLVNEKIRFPIVSLIDENKKFIGKIKIEQAQELANNVNLDLLCVSTKTNPPVCRIIDYSKYSYGKKKQERLARKNQQKIIVKEVRLTPRIDSHDQIVKIKKIVQFLKEGKHVQVSLRYRYLELKNNPEVGYNLFKKISEEVKDIGVLQATPQLNKVFLNGIFIPLSANIPKQQQ